MIRSRLRIFAATAAVLGSAGACDRRPAPPKTSGTVSPSAVVTTLYRYHFTHGQNWDSTYAAERTLFAPELAARLDADVRAARANPNEIVGLDFDPLTDAQDSMTGYAVVSAEPQGASGSIVAVEVRQDSARIPIRVHLTQTPAGWLVADIQYREGTLVSILDQLAAERRKNSAQGSRAD
jgi:hypothetical protein